jgi:ubiquinone/menaquinone biosynthesis C-methylase UbiE
MLSREQVRSFYDRFGTKQDWQRFYEGPAIRDLLAHGAFEEAGAVLELGCGTGRLAAELLVHRLPASAAYLCLDISSTMVTLSQNRLSQFKNRAKVRLTDGSPRLSVPDSHFDRFIANYVLDLMPAEEIRTILKEAHRVLVPGGRICLISLTEGFTLFSRMVVWLWKQVYLRRPSLVGGCRPLQLLDFLSHDSWKLLHHSSITTLGIPSEVVVARKVPPSSR